MKYDYLIVGAGLFGAVFAQQMTEHEKKSLVVEKRGHIAGNCYTESPINNNKNNETYKKYNKLKNAVPNVIFGGRLAEYRYYDMDAVVLSALNKSIKSEVPV